jgi:hypothetical protein
MDRRPSLCNAARMRRSISSNFSFAVFIYQSVNE